jgi:hypothetical protein
MRVTLTKSTSWWWLSRKQFMKVTSHEIPRKAVMKTSMQTWRQCYFHEGGCHGFPIIKIIHGGELSWKCHFRVSIILRIDAWRCTLTHYFHESKTIFRDVFCTLTKSLDSGTGEYPIRYLGITERSKKLTCWRTKHLPYGGTLILINSLPSSLPMFMMSFLKYRKVF